MLTIASSLNEEEKQEIRDKRNAPGHPMPHGLLQNNREYWVKVKVTDDLAAEDSLCRLLQAPQTVEGEALLGFQVVEIAWAGIGKLQVYQEEIMRFVNTELESRVAKREGTKI
jgi:hypothetical protein